MSIDRNPKTHISDDWREKPLFLPKLDETQHVAAWMVVGALLLMVIGYGVVNGKFDIVTALNDFYANISSELLSIAATVLIIERLNNQRSKREAAERDEAIRKDAEAREKADLILQMGSRDNGFAREAVRKLRVRGWLEDGSLRGANLEGSHLQKAYLSWARLEGAYLRNANLQSAYLSAAHLERSDLMESHLDGAYLGWARLKMSNLIRASLDRADLKRAHLEGSRLIGTHLVNADLKYAKLDDTVFDESTKLPDGTHWHKGVDMSRFTDPNHPDFWEPEWVKSQREVD